MNCNRIQLCLVAEFFHGYYSTTAIYWHEINCDLISKFVRTGYKLELKTSVNLIPSYIRHHQVASVAIFLFQFFFTYFFFRTWKTWKSDCSDFLRYGKLKIGTNMTKSGQLAGMLLKGTVACYHSSYFGRSRSSHRPPTPPPPPEFYTGFTLNSEGSLLKFQKSGKPPKSGKFSSLTLKNIKNNKCLAVKWLMNLYSKNEMYAA